MVAKRGSARWLVKAVVGVVAVVGVAFLVFHTAKSSRAEPYTLPAEAMTAWRLSVEMSTGLNDPVLMLRPPSALTSALFEQTFKRSMESMSAPATPGLPLVLQGELERAGPDRPTPDELLRIARQAGLDSSQPTAVCLAHRRMPEPDARAQAYFAIFDSPAFTSFRTALAARLGASFDPALVSPTLFVGTVNSELHQWLPLRADPAKDCQAPIVVQPQ